MISFRKISVNPIEASNKLFLVYTRPCSFKSHSDKIKKIKAPSSESGIYVSLNQTHRDGSGNSLNQCFPTKGVGKVSLKGDLVTKFTSQLWYIVINWAPRSDIYKNHHAQK